MVVLDHYLEQIKAQYKVMKFMAKKYTWTGCWVIVKGSGASDYNMALLMGEHAPSGYVPTSRDRKTGFSEKWSQITFISKVLIFESPIKLCAGPKKPNLTPKKLVDVDLQRANCGIQEALLHGRRLSNNCPW